MSEALEKVAAELGRPRRMLVVDDNEQDRTLYRIVIERFGATCDEASGGKEAEAKLRDGHYDLALIDLLMPDKGGEDVVTALLNEGNKTPMVIFTGGNVKDEIIVRMWRLGVTILQKPCNMDMMRKLIYGHAALVNANG